MSASTYNTLFGEKKSEYQSFLTISNSVLSFLAPGASDFVPRFFAERRRRKREMKRIRGRGPPPGYAYSAECREIDNYVASPIVQMLFLSPRACRPLSIPANIHWRFIYSFVWLVASLFIYLFGYLLL